MELELLNSQEITYLHNWKYDVVDDSISTKIFTPFWNYILNWLPLWLAPNVITVAGMIAVIVTYLGVYVYGEKYSTVVYLLAFLGVMTFHTLDALDGKQARRTGTSSPVGELLDHTCDQITGLCLTLTSCHALGLNNPATMVFAVLTGQLIFFYVHFTALIEHRVYFPPVGPIDLFLLACLLFICRAFSDNCLISHQYLPFAESCISYGFIVTCLFVLYRLFTFPVSSQMRWKVSTCILVNCYLLVSYLAGFTSDISMFDCITIGLVSTLLTSDVIVTKMVGPYPREINQWVVIMTLFSLFGNSMGLIMTCVYHYGIFGLLAQTLDGPMWTIPVVNVERLG